MKKSAKLKQNMLDCIAAQKCVMKGDYSGLTPYSSFVLGELTERDLDAVERFINSFDHEHP